jgi:uncharacterized protein (TIGR02646 family)
MKQRRGRYNQKEVRQALDEMYRNYCCYCEGAVGAVGADQIEHRKPVDTFPRETFEWENLHLACVGCNRAKSNKWDQNAPILDAAGDIPIDDHLGYQCSETGMRRTWFTSRGETTVKHANINREKLRWAQPVAREC